MCLQRRLPRVAVVGGRGDVDLDARLVEREAGERHVVLPADQAAEPAERRLDRAQPTPVALAPDEPLVVRRHELAVVERELALRRVVEERVVERARPLRVRLVDPDDEPDAVLARDRGEPVGVGARRARATRGGAARTPPSRPARPSRRAPSPTPTTGTRARRSPGRRRAARPAAAASAVRSATRSIVPERSKIAGSTWTQAAVTRSLTPTPAACSRSSAGPRRSGSSRRRRCG